MSGLMIQDTDYANLQGAYPYLNIEPLSTQEEHFLLNHFRGLGIPSAERAAGMGRGAGKRLLAREGVSELVDYLREQLFGDVVIDAAMLNSMALEAIRKAGTATEELKGVEVLAKINLVGGYAPPALVKIQAPEEKDVTPTSTKALERMSDDDLLGLADFDGLEGGLLPSRDPRDDVVDVVEADTGSVACDNGGGDPDGCVPGDGDAPLEPGRE